MKSTRESFGDYICDLYESIKKDRKLIVLSADLAGPTGVAKFKSKYPGNYIDCGIAEANMISMASGLAENNILVFVTSFASFLTGRYDQIRCSLAYPNRSNVILIGTHAGMAIGRDGVTQMGLEDISLMRSLPNMHVYSPCGHTSLKNILDDAIKQNGPCYIRLYRQPVEDITKDCFGENKLNSEISLIFTGCLGRTVLEVKNELEKELGINVAVHICEKLSPNFKIDNDDSINYNSLFVTIEDHSITGGLGSAVAELISERRAKTQLLRIGLNNVFPESGSPDDLYSKYGLDKKGILNSVIKKYRSIKQ